MRSLACKLLTLLLALFLLLSFSAPAFALPMRYWLAVQDVDEIPHPHAMKYATFYVVISLPTGGFMLFPIVVKSKTASEKSSDVKTSGSPRLDEYTQ